MAGRAHALPDWTRWGGLAVLLAATLVGMKAIVTVLAEGHMGAATTQHVPWGLWVAAYIFFLGLSAGSFLLSTLVYVFGVKKLEAAGPLALVQAFLCLVLGGILIVLDLGHPERVYLVLFSMNPSSVMAWMGIFYNLYILIVLAEIYLAFRPRLIGHARSTGSLCSRLLSLGSSRLDEESLARDRKWLKFLGMLGIPVTILVSGGVGVLFAVAKARPGWFSGLFPIIFLITALASGGALLTFLTAAFSRRPREEKHGLVQTLLKLTVGFLAFDLLLLTSEILVTFYGNVPHESAGWRLTLFGPFWWVFWYGQLLIGAAVPSAILLCKWTRKSTAWLGFAGLLVVVGILGARLNLVIPPQIELALPGLAGTVHHERYAEGYFPSAEEWLVTLGVLAIGVWLFMAAYRWLPLEEDGEAAQPATAPAAGAASQQVGSAVPGPTA